MTRATVDPVVVVGDPSEVEVGPDAVIDLTDGSAAVVVQPGGDRSADRRRVGSFLGRTVVKAVAWCGAAALTATVVPSLAGRWWEAPEKLERARAAFRAEQPALAADLAGEAFTADPTSDDAAAVLLAAQAAEAETSGDWGELVRPARELAVTRPHDAADVGNAALVLLNAGHCDEAATLYRARLALGADDAETRVSLAEATLCSVRAGGLVAAVAVLDDAPRIATEPELLLSRAVLRAAAGRDLDAQADLVRARRAAGSSFAVGTAIDCLSAGLPPTPTPPPTRTPGQLDAHVEAVFSVAVRCRPAAR